jgi:hypothetical protein
MPYRRKIKTIPMPLRIPAFGVLLFGLYACTQNLPVGLLFVAVATVVLTFHDGVEIDFANKRIRQYSGMAGGRFGSWEALPAADRLTLVPVRKTYTVYGSRTGKSADYRQQTFEVHLYPQGSPDHYVVSAGTYEAAKTDAEFLSGQLQVVSEDFTVAG